MDDPRLRSLGERPRRPPPHGGPARRPRGPNSHRKPFHHRGWQDDVADGVHTDGAVLFLYACLLSLSPPGRFFMMRNKVQDLHVSDFMSTELVTASPDETLGDVLGKMKSNDIHELPVLDRKKLVGVVTMRELMRRRNIPPNTKVSTVLEKPPEINPETPLPEAAEKMISAGFRAIPVMKGKGLLGIISRSDIVRALVENRALEGVRVSEFMTPNPQAVAEDDTVDHAVQIMRSLGERSVPVVDKNRHLRGVVGLKDIVELFDEPKDTYDEIYEVIQKEMRRIAPLVQPRTLAIHFQKYKPEGDRWKYSLRARFTTSHRIYYAHEFDWDLRVALTKLLDTLYKRIVKEKERKVTERKRHHAST